MRPTVLLAVLICCAAASAQEVTFDSLMQDSDRAKELEQGIKLIRKYYDYASNVEKGDLKFIPKLEEGLRAWRKWLAATPETMGLDLEAHPQVVVEVVDRGHVNFLAKYKTGNIEYFKRDAQGWRRGQFEYAVLVPKGYKPKADRLPLVVSLHERAINPKHPAFKNKTSLFPERSRKTIYDNWYRKPQGENVVVIAPTGTPDGFKYEATQHEDRQYDDRQALYLALGFGLTDYRTDWNRVFVEVHGGAMRLAVEQALMFAGIIVRDRADDTRNPIFDVEADGYLLENLNGTPFCYIADEQHWDAVGKPLADALTAYYAKIGKPGNLVVMKVARDSDGALKADEEELRKFISQNVRPWARRKIVWRFPDANGTSPAPIEVTAPNFALKVSEEARKQPMSVLAGSMVCEVKQDTSENRIEIAITEAEGLEFFLYDGFVNLSLPVTVVVNGNVVVDKQKIERDWGIFTEKILPRHFFMIPMTATLDCQFPHKPQFEEPEEKKPDGAGEASPGEAESTEDASSTESVQKPK